MTTVQSISLETMDSALEVSPRQSLKLQPCAEEDTTTTQSQTSGHSTNRTPTQTCSIECDEQVKDGVSEGCGEVIPRPRTHRTSSHSSRRQSQLVDELNAEVERLKNEVKAKDILLDEMSATLKDRAQQQEDFLKATQALALQKEACCNEQLDKKDHEIAKLQSMLDEVLEKYAQLSCQQQATEPACPQSPLSEKPLHYEFLLALMKERDELIDRLHDSTLTLRATKAALGTVEFEKEKLLLELRETRRKMSQLEVPLCISIVDNMSASPRCMSPQPQHHQSPKRDATANVNPTTDLGAATSTLGVCSSSLTPPTTIQSPPSLDPNIRPHTPNQLEPQSSSLLSSSWTHVFTRQHTFPSHAPHLDRGRKVRSLDAPAGCAHANNSNLLSSIDGTMTPPRSSSPALNHTSSLATTARIAECHGGSPCVGGTHVAVPTILRSYSDKEVANRREAYFRDELKRAQARIKELEARLAGQTDMCAMLHDDDEDLNQEGIELKVLS